jgi:AcrR family transcriptional regulator
MRQEVNGSDTPAPPPGRRARSKADRRTRIVEAACRLVREQPEPGLDGVTATAIAEAAGVSRATFFRYFDSRESAVITGFYEERLAALLEALEAQPPGLSAWQAVTAAVRRLMAGYPRHRAFDLLQGRIVESSPALRARALEFQHTYVEALAAALAPRCPGPPAPDDPSAWFLADHAVSVLRVAVSRWVAGDGKGDLPAMVECGLAMLNDPDG